MEIRNRTTISVGKKTKPIFEALDKVRPNNVSFSSFLAHAAECYVENHNGKVDTIPVISGGIMKWNEVIHNMTDNELTKLNEKSQQLFNLTTKEIRNRL